MVKKTIVAAVLVTAVMLALPFAFAADDSEAASMTEGSSGVGYTAKDISDENMEKLFGPSNKVDTASSVLSQVVADDDAWDITDVKISDVDVSDYKGMSIDGGTRKSAEVTTSSGKIEFKATCNTAGQFLKNQLYNSTIFKVIGTENTVAVGSTLDISAEIDVAFCSIQTGEYEKNSADNLVLLKVEYRNYHKTGYVGDATYKYGDGKSIDFSFDHTSETSSKRTVEYDFMDTKIADVTDTTKCFMKDVTSEPRRQTHTVECNGEKTGYIVEELPDDMYSFNDGEKLTVAVVSTLDMKVIDYKFYAPTNALFSTVYDSSLEDNAKLKEFLDGIGSTTESFSDVEDKADSVYSEVTASKKTDWTKYALIGAAAVLAVVAVAFAVMYFRK